MYNAFDPQQSYTNSSKHYNLLKNALAKIYLREDVMDFFPLMPTACYRFFIHESMFIIHFKVTRKFGVLIEYILFYL